jgi:peptidoglycan/LPS O-acetylase OafA/YrhL
VARLESLRGVAALTVAVAHSFRVFPAEGAQGVAMNWIDRVFNGNAAVTLFFVLSGYVLGMSLRHAGIFSARLMGTFGVRRFLRIYPVFLFSTLVVVGCVWSSTRWNWPLPAWFSSGKGFESDVLQPGHSPGVSTIISNLLLWNPSLNPVTWTLGIELRCSLLLPLLHWWSGVLSRRGRVLLLLALVFAACIPKWCLVLGSARTEALVSVLHNAFSGTLFLFYLGYLLPEIGPALFARVNKSAAGRWALTWAALVIFLGADRCGDELRILQGASAAWIVGSLLYGTGQRAHRWLDLPWARFYGRISYSFYLWHELVLIVTARILTHYVPTLALARWPLIFGGLALSLRVLSPLDWPASPFGGLNSPSSVGQSESRQSGQSRLFYPPN